MNKELGIVGITMGDPAGISPEIILKLFTDPSIYQIGRPLVIGDSKMLQWYIEHLKLELVVNNIQNPKHAKFNTGIVDIIDMANADPKVIKIGKVSAAAGKAAAEYIEESVRLALNNEIQAILTTPANKKALDLAGYHYQGQAEFFQNLTGAEEFTTMLLHDKQRVGLLSTHLSLKDACELVKKERIVHYLKFMNDQSAKLGLSNPQIAVAALNPHGGDGGLFGSEEINEIAPAIEVANQLGIRAIGPIPAQDIFRQAQNGKHDLILAMYHDQAAVAMDILYTTTLTLGLPVVRTSVGHGTGFDIAGKGIADAGPLRKTYEDTAFFSSLRLRSLTL